MSTVLVMASIAVMKDHDQNASWRGKNFSGLYIYIDIHHQTKVRTGVPLGQEPEGRSHCRGHRGVHLILWRRFPSKVSSVQRTPVVCQDDKIARTGIAMRHLHFFLLLKIDIFHAI